MDHQVAREFFDAVVGRAAEQDLLSDAHFTVDGMLIQAAASLKSFRPKASRYPMSRPIILEPDRQLPR